MDSYMRMIDPKNMEYVLNNQETEAPSVYPESMRNECLIIQEVFKNPTIESNTVLIQYKKNNGNIEFIGDITCPKGDVVSISNFTGNFFNE
jgi:hypothetical protein